jgi:hypothetical protein
MPATIGKGTSSKEQCLPKWRLRHFLKTSIGTRQNYRYRRHNRRAPSRRRRPVWWPGCHLRLGCSGIQWRTRRRKSTRLRRERHRRAPPGNLSAHSIQFGTAVAPSLPQRLQRMRGPNEGTVASSGQSSILAARSWPQCWQVTNKPRTPCRRMLPSVIGRIGSSSLTIRPSKNKHGTESSDRDQFQEGNQCRLVGLTT